MTFTRILLCALAFPMLASAQWPQPVQTIGNVTTNDEVVFADNSGRFIRSMPGIRNYLNNPTNSGQSGYVLVYGADGKPLWSPVQAESLVIGYTTNLVWSDELDGGDFDYATTQATEWGGRLPTRDELVAKVLTVPGWNPNVGYYWSGTITTPGNAYLVDYANGDVYDVPTMGEYDVRAVRQVITTNTALDAFTGHIGQTTDAHGGIMRSASNPGANGQILYINTATGRPYWGTPAIEGGIQYLLTSGVARVNGRYVTTNYAVTVSNGTWDGTTATLTPTGTITVVSTVPIARWEYAHSTHMGMGLTDLIDTGAWVTNAHGLLSAGDIYSVRSVGNETTDIPSIGEEGAVSISLSNLVVWTWGAPGLCGTTNSFEGTHVTVDDPAGELDPVNLRTMQERIADVAASMTPSRWADYDANGAGNKIDGVNMGGRRVYLDNQWSMLGSGGYFALSYNGKDILYVSMSNRLLSIAGFTAGPLMTVRVSTNTVTSKPWIEYTTDLNAGNWIEITNATSTYPVKTNGTYVMTFSNVWPIAFFRAVQASTNVNALVANATLDAREGIILGGVKKTAWPVGATGPAGTSTVVFVNNPTIAVTNAVAGETASVVNLGTPQAAVLQFTLPRGEQGLPGPQGMTNMPAVWDADAINTNRLFYKVGGNNMAYYDANGLTLLQGSLTLYENDLLCNVLMYDGSRSAPSLTLAGHPGECGWYGRGYLGAYGFGFTALSNDVFVAWKNGIKMLSTNAVFDGTHVGDAAALYNYPEPMLTNWLGTRRLPSLVITNAGSLTLLDGNGTNRVLLGGDGSLTLSDGNGTNRVKITTNSFTVTDNLNRLRFSITADTNNTAIIWYDTTNVIGVISDNGIVLVNTNAAFTGKHVGNASGLTSVPEPLFDMWRTNGQTITAMTITNSGNLTIKDSGGTTRFLVTGSTGATTIRGQDTDSRYVMVNTNWFTGIVTNLDLFGKTNIWKYQYGSVTNRTVL